MTSKSVFLSALLVIFSCGMSVAQEGPAKKFLDGLSPENKQAIGFYKLSDKERETLIGHINRWYELGYRFGQTIGSLEERQAAYEEGRQEGYEEGRTEGINEAIAYFSRQSAGPLAGPSSDVVESKIDGEFEGFEGDTVVKLMNGQIWQQTEYYYTYHYASCRKYSSTDRDPLTRCRSKVWIGPSVLSGSNSE